MGEISMQSREYIDSDYKICESLVNNAWGFDKNFKPKEFADVAKCMYTKGSVIGSNFRRIIEANSSVVGFIFGLNEMSQKPKRNLLFGLSIFLRLLLLKGVTFKDKRRLFKALNTHEENRSKVVARGRSEIVLFVVDLNYQGMGNGKNLLSEFILHCKELGVRSVIVETNKLGASGFYEGVSFKHISDFHSPLHEYVTKDGQACIVSPIMIYTWLMVKLILVLINHKVVIKQTAECIVLY
jgi:ribosomal protein S18 acetylase RimI-like enzyme